MVSNSQNTASRLHAPAPALVAGYVVVVVATLAALAVMSAADASGATTDAWVHAIIVGVFAVLLPLRVRSARRGSASATRAVAIIAAVLVVVNVVEALLPGLFPTWMRLEMVAIALLMVALLVTAAHDLRASASSALRR